MLNSNEGFLFNPLLEFTETEIGIGNNTSDKHGNISGTLKIHSTRECVDGKIVNATRQPTEYSFELDRTRGHNMNDKVRKKFRENS